MALYLLLWGNLCASLYLHGSPLFWVAILGALIHGAWIFSARWERSQ